MPVNALLTNLVQPDVIKLWRTWHYPPLVNHAPVTVQPWQAQSQAAATAKSANTENWGLIVVIWWDPQTSTVVRVAWLITWGRWGLQWPDTDDVSSKVHNKLWCPPSLYLADDWFSVLLVNTRIRFHLYLAGQQGTEGDRATQRVASIITMQRAFLTDPGVTRKKQILLRR
jgi:hypothetical protein